ncbi:MAG: chorismate synthase, partial [Syntrophomonadaceae bacterium]
MLRFTTAGESHGPGLVGIIEGLPAGLPISISDINRELSRRQQGYGRGGRMKIEQDEVIILSGVRNQVTLGSPVSFVIWNRDYENWSDIMGSGPCSQVEQRRVT